MWQISGPLTVIVAAAVALLVSPDWIDYHQKPKKIQAGFWWDLSWCETRQLYGNYEEYTRKCCLPEDEEQFRIICKDTYGDGWHGGYLEINGIQYCDDFLSGTEQQEQMANE